MGGEISKPHISANTKDGLDNTIARLEVEAQIVFKEHLEHMKGAREQLQRGNKDAARVRFLMAGQSKQQELQIMKCMTVVQKQKANLQTAQISKDTMAIMKASARSLHSASIDQTELDMVSERLHVHQDTMGQTTDMMNEHATGGDDAEWLAFVAETEIPSKKPPPAAATEEEIPLNFPTVPSSSPPIYADSQNNLAPNVVATAVNTKF